MITPRIEINLEKISHNARVLKELYGSKGINIIGVTKVICGNPIIAEALVKSGINILADSRLENIIRMRNAGIQAQFMLIRSPLISQSEAVIKYTNISLNTEISVIKKLSKLALNYGKRHKIILMVELGDLREGLMPSDLDSVIKQVLDLKGIDLIGIGTNLACFGGTKPDDKKMSYLSSIARNIEKKYNLTLEFVSGGNSSNYDWFMSTKDVGRINNLRLGESIYLGCEPLYNKPIPGLYTDAITLVAEIIEAKIKPVYFEICPNNFDNISEFKHTEKLKRAILGIGLQDVLVSGITPRSDIKIIGASSDHTITNTKDTELMIGDELEFDLNYGALLSAMTSPYVTKIITDSVTNQEYYPDIQFISTVLINENNSKLISLIGSGFNLVLEPSVMKDYKYLVRESVFDKIGRISRILDKEEKILIIRSVWKSLKIQKILCEEKENFLHKKYTNKDINDLYPSSTEESSESMHLTGGAVDALIYDLKNSCIMDFDVNDENFNDRYHNPYTTVPAIRNRELLINLFEEEDFVVDLKEYGHFDYGNTSWAKEKEKNYAIYGMIEV